MSSKRSVRPTQTSKSAMSTTSTVPARPAASLRSRTSAKNPPDTCGEKVDDKRSLCVICSDKFDSNGCHYTTGPGQIPVAMLKKNFCRLFSTWKSVNEPSEEDHKITLKFMGEKFPFCPFCVSIVNDLCRREEQLEISMRHFIKAKDEVLRRSIQGHSSTRQHPHFGFQKRILMGALECDQRSVADLLEEKMAMMNEESMEKENEGPGDNCEMESEGSYETSDAQKTLVEEKMDDDEFATDSVRKNVGNLQELNSGTTVRATLPMKPRNEPRGNFEVENEDKEEIYEEPSDARKTPDDETIYEGVCDTNTVHENGDKLQELNLEAIVRATLSMQHEHESEGNCEVENEESYETYDSQETMTEETIDEGEYYTDSVRDNVDDLQEFKWGQTVRSILSTQPGQSMSIRQLRREVVALYYAFPGNVDRTKTKDEIGFKLLKKLTKKGFSIVDDWVTLRD